MWFMSTIFGKPIDCHFYSCLFGFIVYRTYLYVSDMCYGVAVKVLGSNGLVLTLLFL